MHNPTPQTPHYELVAQINKAKGLDGQLVAQELGGLSVLYPGLEVWIVPPTREGVRHTVILEAQDDFKKHGVLVRLKGVDDRTKATELIGRYLLAHTEHINTAAQPRDYGYDEDTEEEQTALLQDQEVPQAGTVFTDVAYGPLGTLESVKSGPAYDIWVIDGPHGRLEIPVVDEYIREEQAGQITLSLPQGFVEITSVGNKSRSSKATPLEDESEQN